VLTERLGLAEIERRVLASQRDRRHVAAALARGDPAPWDYDPPVDASIQYVRSRTDLYEQQRRARLEAP
jgi:choline-sulfatase